MMSLALPPKSRQPVVLLHGLARSASSMTRMATALTAAGYEVCNIAYPSRRYPIEVLATDYVAPAIRKCVANEDTPINFVTHSLGGILVRQLAASGAGINIGRVVMLGPPNCGSEVVDKLGALPLYKLVGGPALGQLGTKASLPPRALSTVNDSPHVPRDPTIQATHFEVGVIAGNRSVNPILSFLIPGADDGKVAVENTKLFGMKDFLVVPVSHPFIMRNQHVIEQTLYFLKRGAFLRAK